MIASLGPIAWSTSLIAVSEGGGSDIGSRLPIWSVLPFAALLWSIAVLPLVAPHWWHSNRNKGIVAGALAIPFAFWALFAFGEAAARALLHSLLDYASFIALLGALFVISGGILVRGSLAGTPLSNSVILGMGAVLANLIGTTGASMVLIRPLLRANEERRQKVHIVVFFIFVVSNCGGLLTPLGDPPLFLGFLKGVPFDWTLRLWREWLFVNGILIAIFNVLDQHMLNVEEKAGPDDLLEEVLEHQPLRIEGWHNLFFLAGIVLVIIGKGNSWGTHPDPWPFGVQELLMLSLGYAAYRSTRPSTRQANRFGFGPIIEVAVLFAGIFVTMVAPLLVLNARGASLGLAHPWHYFWATGILSSFLDNAPTYLTFLAVGMGRFGMDVGSKADVLQFLELHPGFVIAVSLGSVFFGAGSYIGNGPNFMVKAISEKSHVKTPSFLGYLFGYSLPILVPILAVVGWVMLRSGH